VKDYLGKVFLGRLWFGVGNMKFLHPKPIKSVQGENQGK